MGGGWVMGLSMKEDPLVRTRLAAARRPRDTKLMLELAALLRQRGRLTEAVDVYLRAARQEWAEGLVHKASAIARLAVQLAPARPEAHEALARCLEGTDFRADLRAELRTLLELHRGAGHLAEAQQVEQRLAALEPR